MWNMNVLSTEVDEELVQVYGAIVGHDGENVSDFLGKKNVIKNGEEVMEDVLDKDGNPIMDLSGYEMNPVLDDDGEQLLDDEGNPVMVQGSKKYEKRKKNVTFPVYHTFSVSMDSVLVLMRDEYMTSDEALEVCVTRMVAQIEKVPVNRPVIPEKFKLSGPVDSNSRNVAARKI